MSQQKIDNMTLCPACDALIQLNGKIHLGQRLPCRRCHTILEVNHNKPLRLRISPNQQKIVEEGKANKKHDNNKENPASIQEQKSSLNMKPPVPAQEQTYKADCPQCAALLRFRKPPKLKQTLACPNCTEMLVVVALRPLQLYYIDDDSWDNLI